MPNYSLDSLVLNLVSHSNALECICSCFHCMHESCTPPLPHALAEQLLDSPTSGRVHLWPHVATETGVRAPVRVPASASVCMYVRAHYAYACWASCETKNDSNRVESIAEHSRTEPNRAESALELKPAAQAGRISLRLAVLLICCLLCCAARNANNTKKQQNKKQIKIVYNFVIIVIVPPSPPPSFCIFFFYCCLHNLLLSLISAPQLGWVNKKRCDLSVEAPEAQQNTHSHTDRAIHTHNTHTLTQV